MEKTKKKILKTLYYVGGTVITAIGVVAIPLLIKKYSNIIYKTAAMNEKIDFDSMGPDIVRKENESEEDD